MQKEVIRNREIENALGHSVSKNACGDDLTGALPSQKSVKQEILNVSSRISRSLGQHSLAPFGDAGSDRRTLKRLAVRVCQNQLLLRGDCC
jgi:hypothetical protein